MSLFYINYLCIYPVVSMLTTYNLSTIRIKKKNPWNAFVIFFFCEDYTDFGIVKILSYSIWDSFRTGVTSDWLCDLKESGAGIQHIEQIAVL